LRGHTVKKLIRVSAPVLVLAAGVLVVVGLSAAKPEPEKKEDVTRLISLYVDEVKSEDVTVSVRTQGEVRPKTEIDLVPQVSGRIVGMSENFAVGGEFAPGSLLLKIEDSDYQVAAVAAEARVAALLDLGFVLKRHLGQHDTGRHHREVVAADAVSDRDAHQHRPKAYSHRSLGQA